MPDVRGNDLYCLECDHCQSQINFTICEKCGHNLGPPNVNVVNTEVEINALQKRYDDAKKYSSNNGTTKVLGDFEDYFNANVKAVINMPLGLLYNWIGQSSAYKSYHRAVELGIRGIANQDDDRKRSVIDGFLNGTYGKDIVYAALTLNSKGLVSYGTSSVILNDLAIRSRSSTLEENSYDFVETHNINLATLEIPVGYRSSWLNKQKLAVAKLYKELTKGSSKTDFENLVLFSEGDRTSDKFIEVHIYKELTNLAADFIFTPTPKNGLDKVYIRAIEEKCPNKVSKI